MSPKAQNRRAAPVSVMTDLCFGNFFLWRRHSAPADAALDSGRKRRVNDSKSRKSSPSGPQAFARIAIRQRVAPTGAFSVWDFGNLRGLRYCGFVCGAKGADPCLKIYPNALAVYLIG